MEEGRSNVERGERQGLTTPMMEELNWTSEKRRSSSALRMRSLEPARPSLEAMVEKSMAVGGVEGLREEAAFEVSEGREGGWEGKDLAGKAGGKGLPIDRENFGGRRKVATYKSSFST